MIPNYFHKLLYIFPGKGKEGGEDDEQRKR